jgi:two-component system OmpR family sensor kinase
MKRGAPVSLRNRISLVLVAVVAIALVGANLAVYALVSQGLDRRVDEQLERMGGFADGMAQAAARGVEPPPLDEWLWPPVPAPTQAQNGRGEFFGYVDPNGELVLSLFLDQADQSEPPELPDDLAPRSGEPVVFNTSRIIDGEREPYRMRASARGNGFVVVVGLPTSGLARDLRALVRLQVVAGLTVLVLLALLSRWLVGVGLRPLARMDKAAERIADGDLTHRVEPSGPQTEISRFGATLNRMLGEIEQAFAIKEDSERRLRASEQKLRRFVADASHEMRTPLTSIGGYAQLLRRDRIADSGERTDAAGRIEDQATRLAALVDDLLLLARLDGGDSGEAPLRFEPVDISELAGRVVDDARVVDPDREISFEADGAVEVSGDADGLTRVLTNLVANACQHTSSRSPVEVVVHADDDRDVVVDVVDHGQGISPEVRPQLFNRFFRTDQSRSRDRGGSGLGLAIVAGIVTAHGGRCEALDTPGGGATFRVALPRALPPTADHDQGRVESGD